jgi:hypothetical protein
VFRCPGPPVVLSAVAGTAAGWCASEGTEVGNRVGLPSFRE